MYRNLLYRYHSAKWHQLKTIVAIFLDTYKYINFFYFVFIFTMISN